MMFAVCALFANLCLLAYFITSDSHAAALGAAIAVVGMWASLILIGLEASV